MHRRTVRAIPVATTPAARSRQTADNARARTLATEHARERSKDRPVTGPLPPNVGDQRRREQPKEIDHAKD